MPSRTRQAGDPAAFSLDLTPLLDVVLQLITFFMMLIHFGSQTEGTTRAVRLPVTPAALPGADLPLDRLTVAVDGRGRLLVAGKGAPTAKGADGEPVMTPLDEPSAEAWWAEQAEGRRRGLEALHGKTEGPAEDLPTVVVVRADRSAQYGAVRRALAAAQAKGFAHFSLVTLRREERP